ncbi:MAG TPA: M42 family metallopeptidase [Longilinea sp.]|nr:M42 family metallopeptidase [Longilinea sp.]
MKALIQKLVESIGPSGYESNVRELIKTEIGDAASNFQVDPLGSLLVRTGKKTAAGMRVMLSAHMDEIGVIATHIDENGFVRLTTVGGVSPRTCYGGRVIFVSGVHGVIGGDRPDSPTSMHSIEQLFIDVGATSRENCPVKVGDFAAFDRPFLDLGDRLVAKSMDDRIAVAILVETLRALKGKETPHELVFVFSTQEEVGLRGATAAAYGVDPDLGLSVDVTGVGDTPKGAKMEVGLGKGPAVKVRDGRMLADPRIVRWMVDTAEKAQLPYQLEVLEAGTTDAAAIQLARAGVPAGCMSIPCRYIHSPSEMVDYNDVTNCVRLLVELLSHPIELK